MGSISKLLLASGGKTCTLRRNGRAGGGIDDAMIVECKDTTKQLWLLGGASCVEGENSRGRLDAQEEIPVAFRKFVFPWARSESVEVGTYLLPPQVNTEIILTSANNLHKYNIQIQMSSSRLE